MKRSTTTRSYDARSRRMAAQATRQAILIAARSVFLKKGYAATTMDMVATAAGVAKDTVYATIGKKPSLFKLLVETALSGTDQVVPGEDRDYVQAIRVEPEASKKLRLYATALRHIQPRLAPLVQVLQGAASLDPGLAAIGKRISQRRARNMLLFAQNLAATGRLRSGLSINRVADIIWTMNSSEFYSLLVEQRGWSLDEFENWLADSWIRLLLQPSGNLRRSRPRSPAKVL